jgi:hypothetical protein
VGVWGGRGKKFGEEGERERFIDHQMALCADCRCAAG